MTVIVFIIMIIPTTGPSGQTVHPAACPMELVL